MKTSEVEHGEINKVTFFLTVLCFLSSLFFFVCVPSDANLNYGIPLIVGCVVHALLTWKSVYGSEEHQDWINARY